MTTVKYLSIASLVLGFAALGAFVVNRLSDEAVMTIVGVLCGILASIPVSIGLLIALTRERGGYVPDDGYADVESEPAPAPYHVSRPSPIAIAAPSRAMTNTNNVKISDRRVREWIVATGTVPKHSMTKVWRERIEGVECVCWRNSTTPQETHYAPLWQIAAGGKGMLQ